MDFQYFHPAVQVGFVNQDLAIEPARTKKSGIKYIGPVCCSHDDYSLVGVEPVHFTQKLVQGILPFIIGTDLKPPAPASPDRVYFVDEYNTGGFLLCLFKKITYPGSPDTNKHLHKVGTA